MLSNKKCHTLGRPFFLRESGFSTSTDAFFILFSTIVALVVIKSGSPRVLTFIRGLNYLQRENKGSLNKLGLAKKMSHTKVRTHSVMPEKARVIVAEAFLTGIYLT